MLRVLILSTLFPDAVRPTFGGFVARQTRALADQPGVEVRVVAPIGLPPGPLARHPRYRALARLPRRERWEGLVVERPRFPVLPVVGGRWMPALLAHALLPRLRALRAEWRFDVIDAEFFYPDGPAAMRLAGALDVPFSIKARGSDIHVWAARPGCRDRIVAAGRAAGGLLAVSGAMRDDMVALRLPRPRVHHTGVDLDCFAPRDRAAAKRALGVDGPLVVATGALILRKGHGITIEAVAGLPGVTLLIAGEGPDRAKLDAMIARHGVGDRVRLLGSVAHDRLPAILGAADVMALPSASEGLANAWVEAIACGVPVVTSDVGGARELIDRAAAGRIVAREAGAVREAIAGLLADPPHPRDVRAAALPFTWEANGAALAEHLRGVAGQASG